MEEGVGLLESQCTVICGKNQKKKFLTNSPVEVLILFNEERQGLLKLHLLWGGSRGEWSDCCG